ncbi:AAA family ATPase [Methylobacter svalbardensis]|uniref:AAA family ATPase n=1 Tax=Methylobacter svalbardensis TaxID=3080016 RepID=UPI0030ECDD80
MNYWLVRAKWGGENKKADFINNDEWINGYDDKYLDIVNRVEVEDILLLAEDSTVTHYGVCSGNEKDGRHLAVDKWILLKVPVLFPAKGSYIKTIVKVNDDNLIDTITLGIETTNISNDIIIKSIFIGNFTVFKNERLEFSDGLNVVIGENGTGKSHLLKLLYSIIMSINHVVYFYADYYERKMFVEQAISEAIEISLMGIFKPDELDNLISRHEDKCSININLEKYSIPFNLVKSYSSDYNQIGVEEESLLIDFFEKSCIFIPAKEMLSFYEGFISLYETRETSFDQIYYNLAKSLGLSALKNIESYPVESKLLSMLEEILEGKILLERGRFYLASTNGHKTEIALIAEGLRKIATIAQLIANGSLNKNSIIFWDEPEANLNPKLIRKMAEVLVELSRAGMQVFIATHSLFLVKELEILRSKEDKVKYFSLGFEGYDIKVSQSEDFEYLDDIVILDEELEQDDRFLSKKEA